MFAISRMVRCTALTENGKGEFAWPSLIAKLAKANALPGAEFQAAVADWDGERNAGNGRFNMAGHVVVAFAGMKIPRQALGSKAVKAGFEVGHNRGVGIFINAQPGRGMVNENIKQACLRKFAKGFCNVARYQVKSF